MKSAVLESAPAVRGQLFDRGLIVRKKEDGSTQPENLLSEFSWVRATSNPDISDVPRDW